MEHYQLPLDNRTSLGVHFTILSTFVCAWNFSTTQNSKDTILSKWSYTPFYSQINNSNMRENSMLHEQVYINIKVPSPSIFLKTSCHPWIKQFHTSKETNFSNISSTLQRVDGNSFSLCSSGSRSSFPI